jgi:8-oxo-dGTP diphosphatase
MKLPDWFYRAAYRYGFRAARLVWRVTRPRHAGALVMLWHEEKVLLVRSSYQDVWMAPGGGMEADEAPVEAAIREAWEELRLRLRPEDLRLALVAEHVWNNRHDKAHIFEMRLPSRPRLELDNRELIEARFVTPEEARSLALAPHLRDYFRMKATARGVPPPSIR